MKIYYNQIENVLMQIAIILTILSFSPEPFIADICGLIMFAFWGAVVLFKILNRHLYLDNYVKYLAIIYVVWFLCTKLFYNIGIYLSGGMGVAGYLLYCGIFYIVGMNFKSTEKNVKSILNAFFVGEVLLMLTLLPYLNAISEARYEFLAKNQMGQMLGTGVVFGFFILFQYHKNIILRIAILVFSCISLMSLMIVGSRTPLIAIIVIAIVSFVSKKQKTGSDYAFAFAIIIAITITVSFLGGIDYVLELFEISDSSTELDLNDMTSGRFDLYAQALNEFAQQPLTGWGAWAYVDNFIINILRCGGLLLLTIMLPISYGKMFNAYNKAGKKVVDNAVLSAAAKTLLIFYFVVSLMEGFPPMGPGTSVFFLWILIGIVSGKEELTNATE